MTMEAKSNDAEAPAPCIWCLSGRYTPSEEHVFPDALGCPPEYILRRGVCRPCNNRLGHIDHALLRQFELIAFMQGTPRKGGRRPSVDSWASLLGREGAAGRELIVNAGRGVWEVGGRRLAAASARTGLLEPKLTIQGAVAEASFSLPLGDDPKFNRAVYKVALGAVALVRGAAHAAAASFDPVRRFVLDGEGGFSLLAPHELEPPTSPMGAWLYEKGGGPPTVLMRIYGVSLIADLDPEGRGLDEAEASLRRATGDGTWFVLRPPPPRGRRGRKAAPGRPS